ncbi:MAG: hypothetical protein FWG50_13115, partial [Kiritimatiellaeota bacterium]|nr:hypothetical protein [Kiritimatiellota bacterium]
MQNPAQIILDKAILPTHLSSSEIRAQVAADIRRRAIFSARTFEEPYLRLMRGTLAQVASGSLDDATARMRLQQWLGQWRPPRSPGGGGGAGGAPG